MWKRRTIPLLIGIATVAGLLALRIADPYPAKVVREAAFDSFQRLAQRVPGGAPITVIDVGDASLAQFGQWPWPRDRLALIAERLNQMGAAAISFDMLFPEPDRMSPTRIADGLRNAGAGISIDQDSLRDFDREFASALNDGPSILGFGATATQGGFRPPPKSGFAIVGPDPKGHIPRLEGTVNSLPDLVSAAQGLGSVSLSPTGDIGMIRRLPLLWTDGENLFPALSLESLRVAARASTIVVFTDDSGSGEVSSVRVGNFEVPTDKSGGMWIYFHRSESSRRISATRLLGDDYRQLEPEIAGHIVLIGTSATGLLDIRGTPMGSMAGVEIHAQAIEQMISGAFLHRADWVLGLELVTLVLLGLFMVVALLLTGPVTTLVFAGFAALLVIGGSWLAFTNWGLLIDPTFPLGSAFYVYTSMVFIRFVMSDADKRTIRRAFGHYVAPSLLAKIEANSDSVKLGGEVRDLSVLFLDIRGFTTLSEGLAPDELVRLLNTMFGALGECITKEFGTIDKFIGDAIMAFWNAPLDVDQHARRACIASLDMRQTMARLNAQDAFGLHAENRSVKDIAVGIGVATGDALVGNLGLETRFDYSCVGDTVNVAARVEDACKAVDYDIVVSNSTRQRVPDLAFLEAGTVVLKGKSARETIFILVGGADLAESAAFRKLHQAHCDMIEILRSGEDAAAAIAECVGLLRDDDAGLHRFYLRLPHRLDDFRNNDS